MARELSDNLRVESVAKEAAPRALRAGGVVLERSRRRRHPGVALAAPHGDFALLGCGRSQRA
eukprot:2498328-Pyramimonas_sp.AAC.1